MEGWTKYKIKSLFGKFEVFYYFALLLTRIYYKEGLLMLNVGQNTIL